MVSSPDFPNPTEIIFCWITEDQLLCYVMIINCLHLFNAKHLNKGLSQIVDECQSAFTKGRNIHNHNRLILDMLDYHDFINTDAFVLFLDFYKACDTVEHAILLEVLEFLQLGINFCKIIRCSILTFSVLCL